MSETLFFFKGNNNILESAKKRVHDNQTEQDDPYEKIKESFNKILDGKNLSFLLGSGCSSYSIEEVIIEEGKDEVRTNIEVGIPTMKPLAKEFYEVILSAEQRDWLLRTKGIDVTKSNFLNNIEYFLGVLHSYKFYSDSLAVPNPPPPAITVDTIIDAAKEYIIKKCLNEDNHNRGNDKYLRMLYEKFYRKLLYRNSNLPKANVFTTNYDLYSETALDQLGIYYVNGFSGGIKKYFNPTIFNYALAEKMDLSNTKWNIIDNFVYLYKIHGSINWIADETNSKLFKIREIQDTTSENLLKQETVMIHPTPLKQNASLGSPYADLFREFQKKLMQNNNILVTIGYSFSDEHINNLIYQAFTIPSFRLIILGDSSSSTEIEKLKSLDDPRIWIIGGIHNSEKLHYFEGFVNNILPDLSNDQIDSKIEQAIKVLLDDKRR